MRENNLGKAIRYFLTVSIFMLFLTGCGKAEKKTQVEVFIAASLRQAMTEIAEDYEKAHENVQINLHADSSGTLLTQIEEGYECDIFFSAAEKQMNQLEQDKLIVEGSRQNVLNNQLVLIKGKGAKTAVTGLEDLSQAESFALAAASVPAGKYTREALINIGILATNQDASEITTTQVSKAIENVEISEQSNVSKVLLAVAEGSCEVGTVYLSDTYGYEDKVEIIETVPNALTGDVVYPLCLVDNREADKVQRTEAEKFYQYLLSDQTKEVFADYKFNVNMN